jgi:hypothetical protein
MFVASRLVWARRLMRYIFQFAMLLTRFRCSVKPPAVTIMLSPLQRVGLVKCRRGVRESVLTRFLASRFDRIRSEGQPKPVKICGQFVDTFWPNRICTIQDDSKSFRKDNNPQNLYPCGLKSGGQEWIIPAAPGSTSWLRPQQRTSRGVVEHILIHG